LSILREDDLRVVREDDDVRPPFGYRLGVRQLLPLARGYVFDLLAVATVVITQIDVWTDTADNKTRIGIVALITAGALLFRRRAPFVSVLVVGAGAIAFSLVDAQAAYDTDSMFLVLILASWAAGAIRKPWQEIVAFLAILAGAWTVFLRAPGVASTEVLWVSFPLTVFFALSAAWTRGVDQARAAEERAQRSEEEARRAVEEERNRITRELHDVLAHSVSVMTVQASAVRRLLTPEQERERQALLTVEETGRQALAEMRRLVEIMRSEEEAPALAPQPGIDTLPALVEQVRLSGLPVELNVEGEPVRLPAGVDLSAYRIVQEALTNALKHAGPAHAWVSVRYVDEDVEIEVENDGTSDGAANADGPGLVGMRERVALCGGELHSGPRAGGGFRISARLPVAGSAR
jgi:signal transduction histidine kinase